MLNSQHFFHIISRKADVDLTPLDYYFWGALKDRCYAYKPETIDALKDNIREPFGEILFPLLTERIVLSNNKRNLRKYSIVFLKLLTKKKYLADPILIYWVDLKNRKLKNDGKNV